MVCLCEIELVQKVLLSIITMGAYLADMQIAQQAGKQVVLYKNDNQHINSVINSLHTSSIKKERYLEICSVDENHFDGWVDKMVQKLCSSQSYQTKCKIRAKLSALQWTDAGADHVEKVDLEYTFGGRQCVSSYFFGTASMDDGIIRVICSAYTYSWKEASNWRLKCSYWENDHKKTEVKRWAAYEAANQVVYDVQQRHASIKL
eukprot:798412_1